MSLERQEAIAHRTDELLTAWQAFEPAPLAPFTPSMAALSWLTLARGAVQDIRRSDALPQEDPLQEDSSPEDSPLADSSPEDSPQGEAISPEAPGAPSSDVVLLADDVQFTAQAESTADTASAGQAVPPTAGEADVVTIDGEIVMVALLSGGTADDEPAPAMAGAGQPGAAAAEMDDGVSAVVFTEAINFNNDDLSFPMISPFEGDDASAALARAVSEGLALRTEHKPKARDKNGAIPITVHPGSIPAHMGPPTSGTRLSSP
ncbi:hypothetical protein [Chelatococcus asaccharovorans]|nr:hypothetical protein [Chelatococcus asaccharovorans]MBS7703417.1 hypothetical protein [Chelatococcus asaccharovorans]